MARPVNPISAELRKLADLIEDQEMSAFGAIVTSYGAVFQIATTMADVDEGRALIARAIYNCVLDPAAAGYFGGRA